MILYPELIKKIKAYNPKCDESLIRKGYIFAREAHGSQIRHSGESYFSHPVAVAEILTHLKLDDRCIVAALLHDVLEDTEIEIAEIESNFGLEIAGLVNDLTKLDKIDSKIPGQIPQKSSKQNSQRVPEENLEQNFRQRNLENLQKLVIAMVRDIRVLIIKLADRLHNLRTISFIPSTSKQLKKANESLEIYSPLAGRIGLTKIKEEIEDLAFATIDSVTRNQIIERLTKIEQANENLISQIIGEFEAIFARENLHCKITGRKKKPYSIWQKMKRKNAGFHDLFDIMAFRFVVKNQNECYQALGIINTKFHMIPGTFKDYISLPKDNGYQSLHLSVVGPFGKKIEIQIRDQKMNEIASYGLAAHWFYKEKENSLKPIKNTKLIKNKNLVDEPEFTSYKTARHENQIHREMSLNEHIPKLLETRTKSCFGISGDPATRGRRHFGEKKIILESKGFRYITSSQPEIASSIWISELVSLLENTKNLGEELRNSNLNLAIEEVLCFSPTGEIYNLSLGATVIDFAYAIHSEIGNHCLAAKVNGIAKPLDYRLESGDQVEIITSKSAKPSLDWLRFAITSRAKSAIRNFIRHEKFDEFKNLGRVILQNFFHSKSLEFSEELLSKAAIQLHKKSSEELCCKVAEGSISRLEVLRAIYPNFVEEKTKKTNPGDKNQSENQSEISDKKTTKNFQPDTHLEIDGIFQGMAISFAKCCNPVFGDEIIGIIDIGLGISVHLQICPQAQNFSLQPQQIVDLRWNKNQVSKSSNLKEKTSKNLDNKAVKTSEEKTETTYQSKIKVCVANKAGSLADITNIIASRKINIFHIKTVNFSSEIFEVLIDIEIKNIKQLEEVLSVIKFSKNTIFAERTIGWV